MKNKNWAIILFSAVFLSLIFQLTLFFVNPEVLVFNDKFGLGLFGSNSLAIFVLFTALLLLIYLFFISSNISIWALVMIFSGVISNLFDRIFRGSAVDYISIAHWPTFNLADISIVTGILLLLFNFIFSRKPKNR